MSSPWGLKMSKLISQLALALLTLSTVEAGSAALASTATSYDPTYYRSGTLNCSSGTCIYQRSSSTFATASAPKSVPEPGMVGALLGIGAGVLLSRRKGKPSPLPLEVSQEGSENC